MNMTERFKQAQNKVHQPVNVEVLLETAATLLDAHEGVEHVSAIEHLFNAQAMKALKESKILKQNKFYSKRQAASHIWMLWRQM